MNDFCPEKGRYWSCWTDCIMIMDTFVCDNGHQCVFSIMFMPNSLKSLLEFTFTELTSWVHIAVLIIIIIIEICKVPTLRLKALNKHTHIMYIEMDFFFFFLNVFSDKCSSIIMQKMHTHACIHARTHAHAHACTHTHTHTLYGLMGVKDNVV